VVCDWPAIPLSQALQCRDPRRWPSRAGATDAWGGWYESSIARPDFKISRIQDCRLPLLMDQDSLFHVFVCVALDLLRMSTKGVESRVVCPYMVIDTRLDLLCHGCQVRGW